MLFLGVLIGGAIGASLGYLGKCSADTCPLTANPYRGAICGAVMGALLMLLISPKTDTESGKFEHCPHRQQDGLHNPCA